MDQAAMVVNDVQPRRQRQQQRVRRRPLIPFLLILAFLYLLSLPTRTVTSPDDAIAAGHRLDHGQEAAVSTTVDSAVPATVSGILVQDVDLATHDGQGHAAQLRKLMSSARDGALAVADFLLQKRQFPQLPQPRRQAVLECLEVKQPVLVPANTTGDVDGGKGPCEMLLMKHVFAFSYGQPFIGNYTPPSCDFNRVVMNFSVVSAGRQFDRLALMYLNDTEVWRTSTAEPVTSPGIHWEYIKDMTQFLSLWKKPQRLIFDLGNLINANYTASFNTTLTATFFKDDVRTATSPPADVIIPISARNSARDDRSPTSVFLLPEDDASTIVDAFPRNVNRAVLSIQANGQAAEEFWWSNYLQSDVAVFNSTLGMAPGMSPFREVAAFIDGKLAGVQWPFPVIFTGGIAPMFHRPVVGLQAFDLLEHQIDITPWLPLLCDGNPHNFSFAVSGLLDDRGKTAVLSTNISNSWYITGKVFVWLDDEGSITTGSIPEVHGQDPSIQVSNAIGRDFRGRNQTINYSVAVKRDLSVVATVKTQKSTVRSSWRQVLSYDNTNNVTNYGQDQITNFGIVGSDKAYADSNTVYAQDYSYPLAVNMQTRTARSGAMTLNAGLYQGMTFQVAGASVFPDGLEAFAGTRSAKDFKASVLSTFRQGAATYRESAQPGVPSTGTSNMRQEYAFGGNFERYPDISARTGVGPQPDVMLYYRNLTVVNGAITRDRETIADRTVNATPAPDQVVFAALPDDEYAPARSPVLRGSVPAEDTGVGYGRFMARLRA